jgi:DNA-directed RNA polymerase specialized sigma24 family protein
MKARSILMSSLGALLIVVALLLPGRETTAITTLIIVGAGDVTIAILWPYIKTFEIGAAGLKTELGPGPERGGALDISTADLTQFAYLACGDKAEARRLLEEALIRTHQRRLRRRPARQEQRTIRALIELLDTARDRRWLGAGGRDEVPEASPAASVVDHQVLGALQVLDLRPRVTYLLRTQLGLSTSDAAAILESDPAGVAGDFAAARQLLAPYMTTIGPADE